MDKLDADQVVDFILYKTVDAAIVFLTKKKVRCTSRLVASTVCSLRAALDGGAGFTLAKLAAMCATFAPLLIVSRATLPGPVAPAQLQSDDEISLFPAGAAKATIAKRHAIAIRCLLEGAAAVALAAQQAGVPGPSRSTASASGPLLNERAAGITSPKGNWFENAQIRLDATHVPFELTETYLRTQPYYVDQIVKTHLVPAVPAKYATPDTEAAVKALIRRPVWAALHERGIDRLYAHQAAAVAALMPPNDGHVVVSTSTSSGKSLVYTVPVLDSILADRHAVSLLLFPTKALAQDQMQKLDALVECAPELLRAVTIKIYDGDTTFPARDDVRDLANVILTNPDMIHCNMLAQHQHWARVFRKLRYVVVDEVHMYKGAFGAHVSLTLRRLMRLAANYGSAPQFICCSATMANPEAHFKQLIPEAAAGHRRLFTFCPDVDGSPSGSKLFIMWNPARSDDAPETQNDKKRKGGDASAVSEADALHEHILASRQSDHGPTRADDEKTVEVQPPVTPGTVMTGTTTSWRSMVDELPATIYFRREPKRQRQGGVKRDPLPVPTAASGAMTALIKAADNSQAYAAAAAPVTPPGSPRRTATAAVTASPGATTVVLSPARTEVSHDKASQPAWVRRWIDREDINYPRRRSTIFEAALIFSSFIACRKRTLVFTKATSTVEIILQYTHSVLRRHPSTRELMDKVMTYRGGYTKERRRLIERQLFHGELLGVISTNALELGVDIGSLDAVVMVGYPGSISSVLQQAGRAGRGTKDAVIVFLAWDSPLEQFLMTNPERFLHTQPEGVAIQCENELVLRAQLLCAAAEIPLAESDAALFGPRMLPVLESMVSSSVLERIRAEHDLVRWAPCVKPRFPKPWTDVCLRSISQAPFVVVDVTRDNLELDEIDARNVLFKVYPGAIYLNQGVQYKVEDLDFSTRVASVRPDNARYYTEQRDFTNANLLSRRESTPSGHAQFGLVQVSTVVVGFKKIWHSTRRIFEVEELNLPAYEFKTEALWTDLPFSLKTLVEEQGHDFLGGCHAISHAIVGVLPWFVQCDRADVGCECPSPDQVRHRPMRFMVFDTAEDGLGVSRAAFRQVNDIYKAALDAIRRCPCDAGCPSCVFDGHCSEYNLVIDKAAAVMILECVLEDDVSASRSG